VSRRVLPRCYHDRPLGVSILYGAFSGFSIFVPHPLIRFRRYNSIRNLIRAFESTCHLDDESAAQGIAPVVHPATFGEDGDGLCLSV
jgi:hypothetical protein